MVCVCVCVCATDVIPLTAQLLDDDRNSALHADLSVKQHTSELYADIGVGLARGSLNRFKPRRSVQKFDSPAKPPDSGVLRESQRAVSHSAASWYEKKKEVDIGPAASSTK